MNKSRKEFSFIDHLDELRGRILQCLVALFAAGCLVYQFIDPVLETLIQPVGKVFFTSPADAFLARITLTIYGSILLTIPFLVYHAWQFISLGLKDEERRLISLFVPCSLLFFVLGGTFAYMVAIPFSIRFLLGFSSEFVVPMITIQNYISFIGSMILAFGVIFELPLILMFLTKIGIATPEFLIQKRKHAVVLILMISAVLTPPDVVSQLIMTLPLLFLYEVGVILSKMICRQAGEVVKRNI